MQNEFYYYYFYSTNAYTLTILPDNQPIRLFALDEYGPKCDRGDLEPAPIGLIRTTALQEYHLWNRTYSYRAIVLYLLRVCEQKLRHGAMWQIYCDGDRTIRLPKGIGRFSPELNSQ